MREHMGSKIKVHRVQPGEAKVGCDPRGVQIFYKEDLNVQGDQNLAYIRALLQRRGFDVKDGDRLSDSPLRYLCVRKADSTVKREEVLQVLKEDDEVDLSSVDRPEGHQGLAL